MEQWENSKPGGHLLSWDGDVKSYIRCSLCTKSWPYKKSGRMTWKTDVLETCAGTPAAAEQLRSRIRQEIAKTSSSQHNLFSNRIAIKSLVRNVGSHLLLPLGRSWRLLLVRQSAVSSLLALKSLERELEPD